MLPGCGVDHSAQEAHCSPALLEPEPDVAVVIEGFSKDLVFLNGSYAPRGHADANGRYRFVKKVRHTVEQARDDRRQSSKGR